MVLRSDEESWRALDTATGEMCPHHHHTKTSAMKCGNRAFFPHKVKAIKWELESAKPNTCHHRGSKLKAQMAQMDQTTGSSFHDFLEVYTIKGEMK